MKSIFLVVVDLGDGSSHIEWHKTMSEEKISKLETNDRYLGGDGLTYQELRFPDNFDLDAFAKENYIFWWYDDEDEDEDEDEL